MREEDALRTDLNVIALAEKHHWEENEIIYGLKPNDKKANDLSVEEAIAEVEKRKR